MNSLAEYQADHGLRGPERRSRPGGVAAHARAGFARRVRPAAADCARATPSAGDFARVHASASTARRASGGRRVPEP